VPRVTVVGATGPVGATLVRQLHERGDEVIAMGRDADRLAELVDCETRLADLNDAATLKSALADAELVAVCANAIRLPEVLGALPADGIERLVAMGSTRRFSAVPDETATAVRDAEIALARLPFPSVMLLATMIYGTGRSVFDQLARFLLVPAPSRVEVQPIHVEDVARCLVAALFRPEAPGPPIVIAGPEAIGYGDGVRRVARHRARRTLVLPVPRSLLDRAGRVIGGGKGMALRRLAENKTFEIADMRRRLGIEPRPFDPAA